MRAKINKFKTQYIMTIEERAKEYAKTPLPTMKVRALREIDYIQGATEQIDLLRNALIERQGEYISLELIKEIFE